MNVDKIKNIIISCDKNIMSVFQFNYQERL